ncbi:hypothetical protein D3C87_1234360 [compost metagenome]
MGHAQNHQGADKFAGEDGRGKTPRRPPALMKIDLRHDPGDQRRQHQADAQAIDRHRDHHLHMGQCARHQQSADTRQHIGDQQHVLPAHPAEQTKTQRTDQHPQLIGAHGHADLFRSIHVQQVEQVSGLHRHDKQAQTCQQRQPIQRRKRAPRKRACRHRLRG